MGYFDPNYKYWGKFDTLTIWQASVLMHGVEPQTSHSYVEQPDDLADPYGEPGELSTEQALLRSAIAAGILSPCGPVAQPITTQTEIRTSQLIPWLREKGYKELADGLSGGFSARTQLIKRSALIKKYGERRNAGEEGNWPTVEADLGHAQTNGLRDAAKSDKQGYWHEEAAIAWARANGRWERPQQSSSSAGMSLPFGAKLPKS